MAVARRLVVRHEPQQVRGHQMLGFVPLTTSLQRQFMRAFYFATYDLTYSPKSPAVNGLLK